MSNNNIGYVIISVYSKEEEKEVVCCHADKGLTVLYQLCVLEHFIEKHAKRAATDDFY